MITWTFDLRALIIGFVLGMFAGAFVVLFVGMRDGGAWDKGFSAGVDLRYRLEDAKNVLTKIKEVGNHDSK